MTKLILFRLAQIAIGTIVSSGLFSGGFFLLKKGVDAKGTLEFKSVLISRTISAESAGLAMILVGLVVFIVPFVSKVKASRGRINIRLCTGFAEKFVFFGTQTLPRAGPVGCHGVA